jgi:hypothetical protein
VLFGLLLGETSAAGQLAIFVSDECVKLIGWLFNKTASYIRNANS